MHQVRTVFQLISTHASVCSSQHGILSDIWHYHTAHQSVGSSALNAAALQSELGVEASLDSSHERGMGNGQGETTTTDAKRPSSGLQISFPSLLYISYLALIKSMSIDKGEQCNANVGDFCVSKVLYFC